MLIHYQGHWCAARQGILRIYCKSPHQLDTQGLNLDLDFGNRSNVITGNDGGSATVGPTAGNVWPGSLQKAFPGS